MGQGTQEAPDNFFGMTKPINCGGIDPVDAKLDGVSHRGLRGIVVLWSPSKRPPASTDCPGSKTYCRNLKPARTKRPLVDLHDILQS
jgi:hypothetical protein